MRSSAQRIAAEFGGTAFLLAVIVGSGIMAQRLSAGNNAVALLANSIATGAGLYALITALAPISTHFNPVVTALAAWRRHISARLALAFVVAQFCGAVLGVFAAHAMFGTTLVQTSSNARTGWSMAFAEFVATLGLLAVVSLTPRRQVAAAVAMYITAAYWFTASTSFANPAVTVARALTASFSGIAWPGVPMFVAAQLAALLVVASIGGNRSASRPARPGT
jgi:glycerol uptake facilitator-like aquaporin